MPTIPKRLPLPLLLACLALAALASPGPSLRAAEPSFRPQEIETGLNVGYAVSIADVNGDSKPDIVVVDTNRVFWYENPTWKRRLIIEDQTKKDNVCIAPYDIDGDGQLDFALGADWRPADTLASGTIQWLSRGPSLDDKWTVHPIGVEPTVHRMRFADFDGDGRAELIVSPLHGRGTRPPNFDSAGVRTLRFQIPKDPRCDPWQPTVINDDVHVSHNLWPTDLDGDGKLDLLLASFEGVSLLTRDPKDRWNRSLIGSGNQTTRPNRGASEIKRGLLATGQDYLATIEPWHGFQVVVYTRPPNPAPATEPTAPPQPPLWTRTVLDEELVWGHAVWCANLDDDPDEELIIGVRDNKDAAHRCGVRIFDPIPPHNAPDAAAAKPSPPVQWKPRLIDPGAVAVEDLAAADLDGDGRTDLVAAGRATKNVRIYWNQADK